MPSDRQDAPGDAVEPVERTHLTGAELAALYRERFDEADLAFKAAFWEILCTDFFQRYVPPDATVVDLGAGSCEFANSIRAARRIAVDLNPDVVRFARDCEVLVTASTDLSGIDDGSVDVVFTSNFFEHLPTKPDLVQTLLECNRVLRDGGRILVLMPNFRALPGRYWDYFDHHLPLTPHSLAEVLGITGFRVTESIDRFLPYTIKHSRLPRSLVAVRWYLRLRPAWRVLGRQMFVAADKVRRPPLAET